MGKCTVRGRRKLSDEVDTNDGDDVKHVSLPVTLGELGLLLLAVGVLGERLVA